MFVILYSFAELVLQPYSKSKLEFESNLSKILSVNCKCIRGPTTT